MDISNASKKDIHDMLVACYGSLETAGKLIFPDRFHRAFEKAHKEIFAALESGAQKILVIAPRGIGKTSINNFLYPAVKILFQQCSFIVPVSASASSAELQSENLKEELIQNPMIKTLFGTIKTNVFSREQWVVDIAGKKICVMPRGAGQQVRGLLYKNTRPDLILIDDLENSENVRSEEQREKLKEWFFGDLINCVDRGSKDWRMIYLGTVLHEDALLVNLMEDTSWHTVRIELCDDDFNSNAPSFMTREEIMELYADYERQGKTDTFYREYRGLPISKKDASFQQSHFRYYDERDSTELFKSPRIETFVIVDPARTVKMKSADSAVIGVSVDLYNRSVYVRDIVSEKLHPEELYHEIASMTTRLGARLVCLEITGLHEFITYPLQNYLKTANIHVELLELHARGGVNEKGKVERVRSLVPFYRQGLIYHNKANSSGLEAQLMSFPRPKKWDMMDALGYLPQILDYGQRFMYPDVPDEYDSKESIDKEFAELDEFYDEPLTEFRVV